MLFIDNMDENSFNFMTKLVGKTGADTSIAVSMYEIGAELGLDKESSRRTAEDVIGRHLVEIKSLSGSVCLTDSGLEAAEKLGIPVSSLPDTGPGGDIAESVKVRGTDRELKILDPGAAAELRGLAAELVKTVAPSGDNRAETTRAVDLSGLIAQLELDQPRAGVITELLLSLAAVTNDGPLREELIRWLTRLES